MPRPDRVKAGAAATAQPHSPPHPSLHLLSDTCCRSLYFYCNRPTVAALITLGIDIGAVASAAFSGPELPASAAAPDGDTSEQGQQEGGAPCGHEGKPEEAGAAAAVAGAASRAAALGSSLEEAVDQASLGGAAAADLWL